MEFTSYLLTALALAFILEGLVYAIFPDMVRKMMAIAITMPATKLRAFGFSIAVLGCVSLWFMRKFAGF